MENAIIVITVIALGNGRTKKKINVPLIIDNGFNLKSKR
jgi:hypothetical protein